MSSACAVPVLFPGALRLDVFAERSRVALESYGFAPRKALTMVGLCRDELSFPVVNRLQEHWGPVFNLSSLAGMLFLGRTGLLAAQDHAPGADGRSRYVVFGMPHIGVDAGGVLGRVRRPGQDHASAACGALAAFQAELAAGVLNVDLDPHDIEQSLLRQRLLRSIRFGDVPDLLRLTEITRDVIAEDLVQTALLLRRDRTTDVAVLSGIVVHGPGGDWIVPGHMAVCDGHDRSERRLAL